jgi:uncharacterized membrane protein YadS
MLKKKKKKKKKTNTHHHNHTHTMNWYVFLFIITHARYTKLLLKSENDKKLTVIQGCMICNDILHFFNMNSVSCYSHIEPFIQQGLLD